MLQPFILSFVVLLCFQALGNPAFAATAPPEELNPDIAPTFETVQKWWNDRHPEPPQDRSKETNPTRRAERIYQEKDKPIIEVRLIDRTRAFLFQVGISPRGRNDMTHLVLVRPSQQDVQELPWPVGRDAEVHDFDCDGISEVVAKDLGSGGGTTSGVQVVFHLDGPQPIILHYASFYENEGAWGKRVHSYYSHTPSWSFVDLNGDGALDLLEDVTIEKGRKGRDPKVERIRNKHLYKNSMFMRSGVRQMNIKILLQKLQTSAVSPNITYSVEGDPLSIEYGEVLDRTSKFWRIRKYDSGNFTTVGIFASEAEACAYFYYITLPHHISWNNRSFFKTLRSGLEQ